MQQPTLIPPATTAERIAHRGAQPLAPRKPQAQPAGLFDMDARAQIDLCDAIKERTR